MVRDTGGRCGSRWQAVAWTLAEIGCSATTLNGWGKKAYVDKGQRAGTLSEMTEPSTREWRIGRQLRAE